MMSLHPITHLPTTDLRTTDLRITHLLTTRARVVLVAAVAATMLIASSAAAVALPRPAHDVPTGDSVGRGDVGVTVSWWQERLNEWLRLTGSDLYPIAVDGDFGPQTETATREFQRASSAVDNDGTVDADDRIALEAAVDALDDVADGQPAPRSDDFDETVVWWQTALNEWLRLTGSDLYPIVVDGIYGPQTETATRRFQRSNSAVDNDGTVDGDDRVALEAAIDALETDAITGDPADTDATAIREAATPAAANETVVWWQTALNEWLRLTGSDRYPIVVDGIYGPQTEGATREFQRASSAVDNDGTVDGDDRVALENAIEALRSGATEGRPRPGSQGEQVAWWQEALNEWLRLTGSDLHPIVVDGDFGPQTETATREFQAAIDVLDVDGIVDPIDRVVLENAIAALGG